MRKKLIAGNWKMQLTVSESFALAEQLKNRLGSRSDVEVLLCPSFPALVGVGEILRGSNLRLGAQGVFWAEAGAFTSQVSPRMLTGIGCEYVILGHSETRGRFGRLGPEVDETVLSYFSETDATLNRKIKAVLPYGLKPILCVGETLAEREANETDQVIQTQLQNALQGLESDELFDLVIAYEPVWAIGTGRVCEAEEANRVIGNIRTLLRQAYDEELAQQVRLLYGGSVTAANAAPILHQPEVDGALVGGASLNAEEFVRITYCLSTHP